MAETLGLALQTDGPNRVKLVLQAQQLESCAWCIKFERVKPGKKAFWYPRPLFVIFSQTQGRLAEWHVVLASQQARMLYYYVHLYP